MIRLGTAEEKEKIGGLAELSPLCSRDTEETVILVGLESNRAEVCRW